MSGTYYTACVCLNGHLITSMVEAKFGTPFCSECGAETITACPSCRTNLRGSYQGAMAIGPGEVHPYCFACGKSLPWTQRKLDGVAELASAIEELTSHERELLTELMPHLLEETPRTAAAGFKIGTIVAKLAPQFRAVLREAIISVAADAGKKALGMS